MLDASQPMPLQERTEKAESETMDSNILLVDDDPGAIELLGHILQGMGNLQFATTGSDALRLAQASVPDLVLLDSEMSGMSGFEVFRSFQADPELSEVPVIFITSHNEAKFEVACFDMGAADFISKPVVAPLVRARVKTQLRMKRMADTLRQIASTDALTGIANRRRFDEALKREWLLARRSGEPIALLMVDVDHFKLFNDHYGHPAGDTCLQQVAQALLGIGLRPADLVARYGGEEFVLLLPQTPRAGAEHMAQCVLEAVAALQIAHAESPTASYVTVSVGISWDDGVTDQVDLRQGIEGAQDKLPEHCATDLVAAADQALYCAKWAGRARAHGLGIA